MKKISLLLVHWILSYLFSTFLGLILFFRFNPSYFGIYIAILISFGFFVLAVFCSAKIVSEILAFDKNDVMFVLVVSLFFGILVIYSGAEAEEFENTSGLISNISFLIAFLISSKLFLNSKKVKTAV